MSPVSIASRPTRDMAAISSGVRETDLEPDGTLPTVAAEQFVFGCRFLYNGRSVVG